MKKINILFWVFNGLLAALMLFSAISTFMNPAATKELMSKHLGYPEYFASLLAVAKVLGVIAIVVPGFSRLKEWAFVLAIPQADGALCLYSLFFLPWLISIT